MTQLLRSLIVFMIVPMLAACSVVQATQGPESRDFSICEKGTPRYEVLAELKAPIETATTKDGRKYDIFKFMQGQHGAVKAGKAMAYGGAAVLTLGLSELIASPLEGAAGKGAEIKVRVIYDEEDRVDVIDVLQDDRWLPVQELGS